MEDEDLGESLPLTGAGAMFIDEAIRSLSEHTIAPCHTTEDVHALLKQSNILRETMLGGHCADCQVMQRSLLRFVEHGGCMGTFHLLEIIASADHTPVWQKASDSDKGSAIGLVIHLIEAAMQGRFVDLRMQDCYNVVKCLQDLCCLDASTATIFFKSSGFSNLSAILSWPEADMRHARWAATVVLKDLVGLALPTDRVSDWCIAKDSVQAISCLIEALHLFNTNGKHLLYETSVLGILLILQHLAQNQTYLTIITGVVEIHQAGDFLFQRLRDRLKDHLAKGLAVKVGLLCFPNGLEEPTSKGCRRKGMLRFFGRSEPVEGYSPLPTC
ncbi:g7516 [Coccomyxa elongata]